MSATTAIRQPAAIAKRHSRVETHAIWPLVVIFLLAIAPLFALDLNQSPIPEATRELAAVFWVTTLIPSFVYFSQGPSQRPPIPFMPLMGIVHGLYYALPPILGDGISSINSHLDPADFVPAVSLIFSGWCLLLATYYIVGPFMRPRSLLRGQRWSVAMMQQWGFAMLFVGIGFEVLRQTDYVPGVISGIATFLASLTLFASSLLMVLKAKGLLSVWQRYALYAAIVVEALLTLGSGSAANFGMLAFTLFVATWVGGGRPRMLWIVPAVVFGAFFVAVRGVAIDYRQQVWWSGQETAVSDRPGIMLGMLAERARTEGVTQTVLQGWKAAAGRSGTLDLMADVMVKTPHRVPFWGGRTYLTLVGFAIPRILWPDKPEKVLGQEFGHVYNYLDANDVGTSINVPFIVEFYFNFGEVGVFVGMVLVGLIYRVLEKYVNNPGQSILTSMCGLMLLLPLRNIESDFSLIFGGLLLNAIALKIMVTVVSQTRSA